MQKIRLWSFFLCYFFLGSRLKRQLLFFSHVRELSTRRHLGTTRGRFLPPTHKLEHTIQNLLASVFLSRGERKITPIKTSEAFFPLSLREEDLLTINVTRKTTLPTQFEKDHVSIFCTVKTSLTPIFSYERAGSQGLCRTALYWTQKKTTCRKKTIATHTHTHTHTHTNTHTPAKAKKNLGAPEHFLSLRQVLFKTLHTLPASPNTWRPGET